MHLIHSVGELAHGLQHILGEQGLAGHEALVIYRNVRRKYAKDDKSKKLMLDLEGVRSMETFRNLDDGLEAAYKASICKAGPTRDCSAMYVTINPRHVTNGFKATHDGYIRWVERRAGLTKEDVRGGDDKNYCGKLERKLRSNVMKEESHKTLSMIDVDDADPNTWLRRVRKAIGEDAIELILETKNGYHVLYQPSKMARSAHSGRKRLTTSLWSNSLKPAATCMSGSRDP